MRAFSLAALCVCLASCDVGTVAGVIAFQRQRSRDSSSSAAEAAPPETQYRVWIATLTPAEAAAQQTALTTSGGKPDTAVWTQLGAGTATAEYAASPAGNHVLVEAGDAVAYHLDAIEALDADGVEREGGGGVFSAQVTDPTNAAGIPDGLAADFAPAPGTSGFAFVTFAGSFASVRVSIWSAAPGPGDVLWTATIVDPGDELAGGAALDPFGDLLIAVADAAGGARNVVLVHLTSAGGFVSATTLFTGLPAAGAPALAIDGQGARYVAATSDSGILLPNQDVTVRKYSAGLALEWQHVFDSTFDGDRIEAHGLAVDVDGNVVFAGGLGLMVSLPGSHHVVRKLAGSTGGVLWTQSNGTSDSAPTYWRAVATGAAGDVYVSGDLGSLATGSIETYARRLTGGGSTVWSSPIGDGETPSDVLNGVGVDAAGIVCAAGSFGRTGGRDIAVLRFTSGGSNSSTTTYAGSAGGDDEALGLAVEADGTAYIVGYSTVAGLGENLWIRKLSAGGLPLWTRSLGGPGPDRAVSVMISGSSIIVVGSVSQGGETDVHVRAYVR